MPTPKVAIIGAGLAGIYAAYRLQRMGIAFDLFEARDRAGGRIFSTSGGGLDLGPTWFWPDFQPRIQHLAQELSLPTFEQHEAGDTLFEREWGRVMRHAGYHSGNRSMRFEGGTTCLTETLLATLPTGSIHLNTAVTGATLSDDGVRLKLGNGQPIITLYSDLWLAVPPRLAARIAFSPALSARSLEQLAAAPTWMAAHAKYVARYSRAFWREQGLSGHAFSSAGPLGEIHDASNNEAAALFGFFAIDAAQRRHHSDRDLKSLCRNQLARLFGTEAAEPLEDWIYDWSTDALTATASDQRPSRSHGSSDLSGCIEGPWAAPLTLIGSEAGGEQSGYMEGALLAVDSAIELDLKSRVKNDPSD